MKSVKLLSYNYPDIVKVMVRSSVYTYKSSEVYCRRFMNSLNYGLGYHALNWFKNNSQLIRKETNHEKVREGKTAKMLPEG